MSAMQQAPVRMTSEANEGRHLHRRNAVRAARRPSRRSPRPPSDRPTIITPSNPFGRDGGPDSDSDTTNEEEQLERERQFAEGYGHGPLDPNQNDQWSESENEEDDQVGHLFVNSGNNLQHVAVARHLLEEEAEDADAEDFVLEALMRVEARVAQRASSRAARRQRQRDAVSHEGVNEGAGEAGEAILQTLFGDSGHNLYDNQEDQANHAQNVLDGILALTRRIG